MRVAMLMADGFEDSEFRHPYDELLAANHDVVVVGPAAGMVLPGKKGTERQQVELALSSAEPASFAAVVIPGGYSPDRLRIMPDAAILRMLAEATQPGPCATAARGGIA